MLVTLNLVPQQQENVLPPQYHVMTKICALKIRVQRFQEKQFATLPPHLATTLLATQELVIPKLVFAQELPFNVTTTTFVPRISVLTLMELPIVHTLPTLALPLICAILSLVLPQPEFALLPQLFVTMQICVQ